MLANGIGKLRKLRKLAIGEDVWKESKARHESAWLQFKRCSPAGVIQQLGVQLLTVVGKSGFWRDGNELEKENPIDWERQWVRGDESEGDDEEVESDGDMETTDVGQSANPTVKRSTIDGQISLFISDMYSQARMFMRHNLHPLPTDTADSPQGRRSMPRLTSASWKERLTESRFLFGLIEVVREVERE
ncbi:hypothetical protein G7Y89_g15362 [Cudoniella acicularis]|uniref:Uncharacterized protein n=1 Tax=Cudoniella acicularis TaxID=354080 RepID=A0A8H4QNL6_9HELO|nr:hypothetical protein G7Y89_g15362 [Cudoniella acicularis]